MPALDSGDTAWLLVCTALVLLMTPGLAFFYAGMVRAKNALTMLMQNYVCVGPGQRRLGGGGLRDRLRRRRRRLVGGLRMVGLAHAADGVPGIGLSVPPLLFAVFQMMFAVLTVALLSGAVADRVRFGAFVVLASLWVLVVYAPLAHWVFAPSGWLAQLGVLDFAGGTVVEINCGAAGLALALVVGRRAGWPREAMPPHSLPLTLLGAGLLWFGWFGFNAGSALHADGLAVQALLNTHLAGVGGLLAWLVVERWRTGSATTLGAASGAVAGLVAVTPACGYVTALPALVLGALAGAASVFAVQLKHRLGYDDALDVVGVHWVGGVLGTLSVGLAATPAVNPAVRSAGLLVGGGAGLLGRQLLAVVVGDGVLVRRHLAAGPRGRDGAPAARHPRAGAGRPGPGAARRVGLRPVVRAHPRPARVSLRERRATVLSREGLVGVALREALAGAYDAALAALLGDPGPGVALVAVGGLGRGELAPGSDLDLVLVHDGSRDVAGLAEQLWYPLWDSGVGLDHSVRTVDEAVAVARADLKAALGLLDARHVAGDRALSAQLGAATRAAWRASAPGRLVELHEAGLERARSAGEVAFLLEPDLKTARGGLRDVHALQALAVAQLADVPEASVLAAHGTLLDVRGELHRRTASAGRRPVDRLMMQEQDAVAAALGHPDADALMAAVSQAGRRVAYASDTTWRRVLAQRPRRRLLGRSRPAPRRPLADDVVEHDGEVVLARDARPQDDPALPLRVARAAARADLPIAPATLELLATACPPLPDPWPRAALDALVGLLAAGPPAVAVLEAFDQAGLLVATLPEWEHVRSRPQRNAVHRYTVDRHLVETAAAAAALTRRVGRPDLLLLAALLHDIGKGLPGDHSEVGAALVARTAPRLGLPAADCAVLVTLVRHHLLLPDVATRRDLADPVTAAAVAQTVGDAEVLDLLHALTEADAAATGPAAWSAWKAGLVHELVSRARALLAGAPPPPPAPLAPWQEALVQAGGLRLAARDDEVTVVAQDRPGLLALAAGVLALHRLDVLSAYASARGSTAVTVLRVAPRYGALPDWALVQEELRRAVAGELVVPDVLRAREQAYGRGGAPVAAPTVELLDGASDSATVVEVRAADALGVLHRIATALVGCGVDVRTAHISTLGADVVDAFYVVGPDGGPLTDPAHRDRVRRDVLAALTPGGADGAARAGAPV